MYATTKPAALKASWSPGRNAYGEQYNRMAAAVQAMTGNIGVLGGCAEGVGKAFHAEAVAYPYDENANIWYASIKSDRWAHCVLNYPNVKREEIGCWPRDDDLDGKIPNIKGIFWQGSDWFNQLTNINKQIKAMKKLELVVCWIRRSRRPGFGRTCCSRSPPTSSGTTWRCPGTRATTTSTGPKVIEPMGESKTDFQVFTELAYRLGFGEKYNPKATRDYFKDDTAVDEAYLTAWWEKVQHHQGVTMDWEEFKKRGVYKFKLDEPHVAFRNQIEKGWTFRDRLGQDRDPVRRSSPTSPTGPSSPMATKSRTSPSGSSPGNRSTARRPRNIRSTSSARIRAGARTRSSTTSPGCAKPTSRK